MGYSWRGCGVPVRKTKALRRVRLCSKGKESRWTGFSHRWAERDLISRPTLWCGDYRRDWMGGCYGLQVRGWGGFDEAVAMGIGEMDGPERDLESEVSTAWCLTCKDSRMTH